MKYLQDMMGFKKAIDKETGVEYILSVSYTHLRAHETM